MNKKIKVEIKFKSLKDVNSLYKMHLETFEDKINVLTEEKDIQEAFLTVKELEAIVVNRRAQIYMAKYCRELLNGRG